MILLVFFLGALQAPSVEPADCRKDRCGLCAACKDASESARVRAVEVLSKHSCPRSIACLAAILSTDTPQVRVAAAKALGTMDPSKAVEALSSALNASDLSREVLLAIAEALQRLDWEVGADPLNTLLARLEDRGRIEELTLIIPVLGSLGSPSSMDPLLRLFEHVEQEGRRGRVGKPRTGGDAKLSALEGPIKAALTAITGGNQSNCKGWREWWQVNEESLLQSAAIVYRCRTTGKRWERKASESMVCPCHEKIERDGQWVKTRLH